MSSPVKVYPRLNDARAIYPLLISRDSKDYVLEIQLPEGFYTYRASDLSAVEQVCRDLGVKSVGDIPLNSLLMSLPKGSADYTTYITTSKYTYVRKTFTK